VNRPERAAASVATWDAHASRYGAQERLETRALDVAARIAAVAPDERLVDLGTGTGALLMSIAGRPRPPRDVVAVDRSPRMLALAGARTPRGWRMLEADARAVPLPDHCADEHRPGGRPGGGAPAARAGPGRAARRRHGVGRHAPARRARDQQPPRRRGTRAAGRLGRPGALGSDT